MEAKPSSSSALARRREAEQRLVGIFADAGWKVNPRPRTRGFGADLRVSKRGLAYAVELKAASEARSDRLIPLFAQAVLQIRQADRGAARPLAAISAPRVPPRVAEQVLEFARNYAPDIAVGIFDFEGLRVFHGPGLEHLNARSLAPARSNRAPAVHVSRNLFSDLNQWMLKVLLAPELPDHLLSSPRGRYSNASELARAAQVSIMSAFRLVEQLRHEGYLHESSASLALVRRSDLFARWQASADRPVKEVPMRFRLPGDPQGQIRRLLSGGRACLALFAAAEALRLGFVHGVPPYVYVKRVGPSDLASFKNLRPCEAGEAPDLVLRQAPSPQSIFRGMVKASAAADVLQVWLDVAHHPARGREQADLIAERVLAPIIGRAD
ncbi:MAG: RpiR family transcriptional regulator [Acidobacteria bacterium]|nr:RpiR family transcriptional regulator [Acidobacteriota bacterium]